MAGGTGLLSACGKDDLQSSVVPASLSAVSSAVSCGRPPKSFQVLFPIPKTTSAPPFLDALYVSTKSALPKGNVFGLEVTQAGGKSVLSQPFIRVDKSQIPRPHATPKYANPKYYASSVLGGYGQSYIIGWDQRVKLLWNNGARKCTPKFVVSTFKTRKRR
jgi:hypothetical protein